MIKERALGAVRAHTPRRVVDVAWRVRGLANSRRFAGRGRVCPCCEGEFRDFMPRANRPESGGVVCPRCRSLERDRLVALYLRSSNLMTEALDVLHVAPENCLRKMLEKQTRLRYTTADLDRGDVDRNFDVMDIPSPDASFDVVIMNHVLEHVPDDSQAMREVRRILRPTGWAVLLVPIEWDRPQTFEDASIVDPKEREEAYGQYDHVRLYGADYIDRLRAAGFDVRWFSPAEREPDHSLERYGFDSSAKVPVCFREPAA